MHRVWHWMPGRIFWPHVQCIFRTLKETLGKSLKAERHDSEGIAAVQDNFECQMLGNACGIFCLRNVSLSLSQRTLGNMYPFGKTDEAHKRRLATLALVEVRLLIVCRSSWSIFSKCLSLLPMCFPTLCQIRVPSLLLCSRGRSVPLDQSGLSMIASCHLDCFLDGKTAVFASHSMLTSNARRVSQGFCRCQSSLRLQLILNS